MMKLLQIKI